MRNLRFFCVVLMSIMTISASAQFTNSAKGRGKRNVSSEMTIKYQQDVNVGVFAGNTTALTIGTTPGVMISDYFFTGLSLNGVVYTEDFGMWELSPLASFKGYLPLQDSFRLFLNPEFGVNIALYDTWGPSTHFAYRLSTGFEISKFMVGVGCGGAGKTSFFAKIGYVF